MDEVKRLELKTKFENLFKECKREGVDKLLDYLNKSDFYIAPSSTRFHGAYRGGLLEHSLNVYETAIKLKDSGMFPECKGIENDSLLICALLHDICKTGFYSEDTRNVKNKETGQWEQVPYYTVDDKMPYGHGEKSVMMISQFINLSLAEKMMIRWHMGAYSGQQDWNTLGAAFDKYPYVLLLHTADMIATHILEVGE